MKIVRKTIVDWVTMRIPSTVMYSGEAVAWNRLLMTREVIVAEEVAKRYHESRVNRNYSGFDRNHSPRAVPTTQANSAEIASIVSSIRFPAKTTPFLTPLWMSNIQLQTVD